jgi:ABC-type transporter Mla maintaining outer membrane lipid asymmetry ATPase subunit MlaF
MATTVRKEDRAPGAKPISEVKRNSSAALYGRSGTGKTTLAASWPKPILYLNIKDNGEESISDVEGIDAVDIETSEDLLEQILWLHKKASKDKLVYKTVVLDTMSQLQRVLTEEMGATKKIPKGKRAGDFGVLTRQDWGKISGDLIKVIMDIRALPVNSVFIAQERVFNAGDEEDDGVDQLAPEVGTKLMPSVNKDLCASVNIVGNTFIRIKVTKKKVDGKTEKVIKKQFCLRLGPNEVYTTKIRKPKGIEAPDFIVDPTYRKIIDIVKGKD